MKFKTNSYLQVFVSLHVGAELQIPLQDSRTKPAFVVLVNHNLKKKSDFRNPSQSNGGNRK